MLNLGLKLSSWRYKQSLKRCVVVADGKTVANAAARNSSHRTPPNASFVDGVATKDCAIGVVSSLSVRIFLPQYCLRAEAATGNEAFGWLPSQAQAGNENGSSDVASSDADMLEDVLKFSGGYYPRQGTHNLKLPMLVQFHDGAFISGSKDSAANDVFCRRIATSCKCVVVAVGYRLAPEHRYPAAMEDGLSTLRWLAKQANLATFSSSTVSHGIVDSLGHMLVDPWISAHVDFSRCGLLGVGAGGTIAYQVCRSARDLKSELDPLKVIGQILLYPLFQGPTSLPSEKDLAKAYFMDQETLSLAWSCMLPEGENYRDQPAVHPTGSGLTNMPSALVITAEQDMLRDRAAAYVDALKEARIDATLMTYRNAVYGFATLDFFINTKLAHACVDDIAIWFDKHVRCSYWS